MTLLLPGKINGRETRRRRKTNDRPRLRAAQRSVFLASTRPLRHGSIFYHWLDIGYYTKGQLGGREQPPGFAVTQEIPWHAAGRPAGRVSCPSGQPAEEPTAAWTGEASCVHSSSMPAPARTGASGPRRSGSSGFASRSVYRADGPTMASRSRSSTTSQATTFHQALR